MTPSHIRNEVLRRIRSTQKLDDDLINALGIDQNAVLEDWIEPLKLLLDRLPPPPTEGEPIRGALPFDLTLSVMGEKVQHSCRLSYIITLYDEDVDDGEGPTRQMNSMASRYDLLDWVDYDLIEDDGGPPRRRPVPEWHEIDLFPLMPRALQDELDYQILVQAKEVEQARSQKSTL